MRTVGKVLVVVGCAALAAAVVLLVLGGREFDFSDAVLYFSFVPGALIVGVVLVVVGRRLVSGGSGVRR
jgi:predicted Co/Zn/Cd cation transporter (cation efflux family)